MRDKIERVRPKLIIVIVRLFAIANLVMLTACGPLSTDAEHVAKARSYFEQGDFNSAAIEAKNALQKNADLADARKILGLTYLQQAQPELAAKELSRALELSPDDTELSGPLIAAFVQADNLKAAENVPLEGLDDEVTSTSLTWLGLGFLQAEQLDKALKSIDKALQLAPDLEFALTAKARWHAQAGDLRAARQHVRQALAQNEDSVPALELLGDIQWRLQKYDEAIDAYQTGLEYSKSDKTLSEKLVQLLIVSGRSTEAEVLLQPHIESQSKDPSLNYLYGLLLFEKGEFNEAQTRFEFTAAADDSHESTQYFLAQVHLEQGNVEQAAQYVKSYSNLSENRASIAVLQASVQLKRERVDAAVDTLESLLAEEDDQSARRLLSVALFERGDIDGAMDVLALLRATPRGKHIAGRPVSSDQLAVASDKSIERQLSPLQMAISGIAEALDAKEFDVAFTAINQLKEQNPDSVTPLKLLARAHAEKGDFAAYRETLESVLDAVPNEPWASMSLADLYVDRGDVDRAMAVIDSAIDANADNTELQLRKAQIASQEGDPALMETTLVQAMSANPGAMEPAIVLARHYMLTDRQAKVGALLDSIDDNLQTDTNVLVLRGQLALLEQRFTDAKGFFEELSKRSSTSIDLRVLLARSLVGTGDTERAVGTLQEALEIQADNVAALSSLTRLHHAMGNLEAYQATLAALQSAEPNFEELAALQSLGDARPPADLPAIPQNLDQVLGKARQQWGSGQEERAMETLNNWINKRPDDLPARMMLARGYLKSGQQDEAVNQYREVLTHDEDNAVALNNLAWYLQDSAPVEALAHAIRAAELSPDSYSTLDTLALLQMQNGQLDKAAGSIGQALQLNSSDPELQLRAAQIYLALDDNEKAKIYLEKVISIDESASSQQLKKAAEDLLNTLK